MRKAKQVAVIGLGDFGYTMAVELYQLGHEVLALDKDEEKVQDITEYVTHAAVCDATDEEQLRNLGLGNFELAVVAIGRIEDSILAVSCLQDLNVPKVVAKGTSRAHSLVLERLGVDQVVHPEADMARRVARNLTFPHLREILELQANYAVGDLMVPDSFVGQTLSELDLRRRYQVSVLAVHRPGKETETLPGGNYRFEKGDIIILIGREEDMERLEEEQAIG
ncbi:TrkA-N domain protein [Limnochorda pilosa]|uniref:TrkA-N domain protein n=1 Tax=Limnochorda pilosa TaxID=1555112 RepID=A0A0K2SMI2_LIMPI|nr:TrkA-N domain protein [Limnochorda pilosa]